MVSRMPGARTESNVTTIGFADAVMDDCQCGAISHIVRLYRPAGSDIDLSTGSSNNGVYVPTFLGAQAIQTLVLGQNHG
jgi:hypothetical protein